MRQRVGFFFCSVVTLVALSACTEEEDSGAGMGAADAGASPTDGGGDAEAGEEDAATETDASVDAGLTDASVDGDAGADGDASTDAEEEPEPVPAEDTGLVQCDLSSIDWAADVLPQDEYVCEDEGGTGCTDYSHYLGKALVRDLDMDGKHEAYVDWATDIAPDFGAAASTVSVDVFVADADCHVWRRRLLSDAFGLAQVTFDESTVHVFLDHSSRDEMHSTYKWRDGELFPHEPVPSPVELEASDLATCDLASVDWEARYMASDGEGWITYASGVDYTDLDGDGQQEAWVTVGDGPDGGSLRSFWVDFYAPGADCAVQTAAGVASAEPEEHLVTRQEDDAYVVEENKQLFLGDDAWEPDFVVRVKTFHWADGQLTVTQR